MSLSLPNIEVSVSFPPNLPVLITLADLLNGFEGLDLFSNGLLKLDLYWFCQVCLNYYEFDSLFQLVLDSPNGCFDHPNILFVDLFKITTGFTPNK